MKKIIITLFLIILAVMTVSCGYYNPENAEITKETIVPDYKKVDNESNFKYTENDTTGLDINDNTDIHTIMELSFLHSDIAELYKEAPYKLLRKNNGVYYTMYCLNDQRLCYVVFTNTKGIITVNYPWIYSDTQVSKDRFKEVIDTGKPVGWDDFYNMDQNIIQLGEFGSFVVYWVSLREGETAEVITKVEPEITYSEKSIYDIILEKDLPENILGKE